MTNSGSGANYLAMGNRLQAAMNRQLQARCGIVAGRLRRAGRTLRAGTDQGARTGRRAGLGAEPGLDQLRRMRSRDLLERRGSEHDRRGATVEITAAGSEALAAAAPDHVALVRSVLFDGTAQAHLQAFDGVISTALDRLAELGD